MPKKAERPAGSGRPQAPKPEPAHGKGSLGRTLARTTLFAAGMAAARIGAPETEPGPRMFDPTLLDRLEAPITRYHE